MGSFTGTVPSHTSGAKSKASKLQTLDDIGTALTATSTDYSASFVIGASVTPPTRGNSVYTAEYRRLGAWVDYTFSVDVGSTWVSGSGVYRFPLPFPPAGTRRQVGRAFVADQGTALLTGVVLFGTPTDTWLSIATANLGGGFLGSGGPGTVWASTDIIQASITYLAA